MLRCNVNLHMKSVKLARSHRRARPRGLTGIGPLFEHDRPQVRAHLLRLSPQDRMLRFGSAASDESIDRFVGSMRLDGSIGLFLDGVLSGVAHLPGVAPGEVEIGISVEERARARGWGHALLEASLGAVHAGGAETLTAHYAVQNRPMVRLLHAMPKEARHSGGDVTARVGVDDWVAEQHASNLLIETES